MEIKAQYERGVYKKDIARKLGVHPRTVTRALKRGGRHLRPGLRRFPAREGPPPKRKAPPISWKQPT